MEKIRGNEISMIFQEPMTSLNPLYTVGKQIAEAIALHPGLSQARRLGARGRDAAPVYIPEPETARASLSAPAVGRHAPARHDRHGAVAAIPRC
jgi:ABC-type microcin C transport system duplicated ATPase subunit YejF